MKTRFNPAAAKVGDVVPFNILCNDAPGNSVVMEREFKALPEHPTYAGLVSLRLAPTHNTSLGGWETWPVAR